MWMKSAVAVTGLALVRAFVPQPSHTRCASRPVNVYSSGTMSPLWAGIPWLECPPPNAKTTRPHPKPRAQKPDSLPTSIVSNKGQTANFMLYWPSITTFTLVSGWTRQHTQRLREAVDTVVQRNPVLTGRAQTSGLPGHTQVSIRCGRYPVRRHAFVKEFDYGAVPRYTPQGDLGHLSAMEMIHFMDEYLAPLVRPAESVIESVHSGNPLFQIDLITLPGGYACYAMRLSHCVGDGVTYYNLMNEINHYFNHPRNVDQDDSTETNEVPPPVSLDWTAPAIATHEIWPSRYSKADVQKAYGFPFLLGLLRNVWTIQRQNKDYLVLSKAKIEAKKRALVDKSQHGHLSSNDVITAALCDANQSSDLFCFTMNMRQLPHCRHYGFNFHNEVPFPRAMAANDPNAFRSMLKRGYHYETDRLPTWPFVAGRVGRLSSLATIQHLIASHDKTYRGDDDEDDDDDDHDTVPCPSVKVLCHGMLTSFVDNVPLDAAFITSMNDDHFLVIHNFRKIDPNAPLLRDILAEVE